MKQYTKVVNGSRLIKPRNKIVIIKDGLQTINPSEQALLADGWQEYVEPEPTAAELLNQAKDMLKNEVVNYDSSDEVNTFYIKETPIWLDKATRAGLKLRFEAEVATEVEETTLWYNGAQFTLKLEKAVQILYLIEIYASACYDNTQRHLANLDKLTTIEEIESYDYKSGYPEKLRF